MERLDTPRNAGPLLLVDDDTDLLWLMSSALKRRGFEVRTFSHAPTIEQVRQVQPSVIFLDLDIGTESGEEVCGKIKQGDSVLHVPIILLSSHNKDHLRETARRCGADGYMTKPFDLDRMSSLARNYLMERPAA